MVSHFKKTQPPNNCSVDMSKLDIFEDNSAVLDKRSKSNWLSTDPANKDSVWHEQIEPGQLEIGKKIFLSAFIFS